jgi:polyhydroxyalkanoate synthesis regulator phasin
MAKLNTETIARLKQLVKDGEIVLQEIDDLKTGLTETVKAIAEELEVKPSQIMKVIKTAHKSDLGTKKEEFEEFEEMLEAIGKGL